MKVWFLKKRLNLLEILVCYTGALIPAYERAFNAVEDEMCRQEGEPHDK